VRRGIVFLDFDGVVNSQAYAIESGISPGSSDFIDPVAVERLNFFLKETGAKVVISSAWRELHPMADVIRFLEEKGFKYSERVIGKTPSDPNAPRGDEIVSFLLTQPPCPFVIFDDRDDMSVVRDHLVQTNPMFGLRNKDVRRALALYSEQA